jgi:hypothetical protein
MEHFLTAPFQVYEACVRVIVGLGLYLYRVRSTIDPLRRFFINMTR